MSRQRKYHKPLPRSFNEVLEVIAKGKGTKKQNKKRPAKKKSTDAD